MNLHLRFEGRPFLMEIVHLFGHGDADSLVEIQIKTLLQKRRHFVCLFVS